MLNENWIEKLLPYLVLAVFFCASMFIRPLLPVDETRYLSVAWEMHLRGDFLVPTLNFQPYFQKPPLLFWLIDLAWSVFGVSRFAALSVIFAISSLVLFLTGRLAAALFPEQRELQRCFPWLMLGSAAFAVYSTLILFDLLLTACVLGFFLGMLAFSEGGRVRYALLAGVCVGMGILAKGPVVFIHVACPVLLYPLWRRSGLSVSTRHFVGGVGLALLVGCAVAMAWLGPALYSTGGDFARGLLWEQSAGRVAGTANGAHARPFYFYLLLVPVMLLPWGLFPSFWSQRPWLLASARNDISPQDLRTLAFLAIWCVCVLLIFSVISGKQPHYLVPLLPPLALFFGFFMSRVRVAAIAATAVCTLGLLTVGQVVAMGLVLYRYDLAPAAQFIADNRGADLAHVGRYQGELTFLARTEKPFEIVDPSEANDWLREHPAGLLVKKETHFPDETRNVVYSQVDQRGYLIVLRDSPGDSKSVK